MRKEANASTMSGAPPLQKIKNFPEPPKSAYQIYLSERKKQIKHETKKCVPRERVVKIGNEWTDMHKDSDTDMKWWKRMSEGFWRNCVRFSKLILTTWSFSRTKPKAAWYKASRNFSNVNITR